MNNNCIKKNCPFYKDDCFGLIDGTYDCNVRLSDYNRAIDDMRNKLLENNIVDKSVVCRVADQLKQDCDRDKRYDPTEELDYKELYEKLLERLSKNDRY